jgi:hypothetical protein
MGRDVDHNLLPQDKGTSAVIAKIVPINLIVSVSYADAELYPKSRPTSRKPLERRQIRGTSTEDYTNKLQSLENGDKYTSSTAPNKSTCEISG